MIQLLFRLPKDTHHQFKITAASLGKSMTQILGELVTEFLKREKGNLK